MNDKVAFLENFLGQEDSCTFIDSKYGSGELNMVIPVYSIQDNSVTILCYVRWISTRTTLFRLVGTLLFQDDTPKVLQYDFTAELSIGILISSW